MPDTPIYPGYSWEATDNHPSCYYTNTVLFRLETRVPHELYDEFLKRFKVLEELIIKDQKELGPRPQPALLTVPYEDYLREKGLRDD